MSALRGAVNIKFPYRQNFTNIWPGRWLEDFAQVLSGCLSTSATSFIFVSIGSRLLRVHLCISRCSLSALLQPTPNHQRCTPTASRGGTIPRMWRILQVGHQSFCFSNKFRAFIFIEKKWSAVWTCTYVRMCFDEVCFCTRRSRRVLFLALSRPISIARGKVPHAPTRFGVSSASGVVVDHFDLCAVTERVGGGGHWKFWCQVTSKLVFWLLVPPPPPSQTCEPVWMSVMEKYSRAIALEAESLCSVCEGIVTPWVGCCCFVFFLSRFARLLQWPLICCCCCSHHHYPWGQTASTPSQSGCCVTGGGGLAQHLLQVTSTPSWSPQSRCCVTGGGGVTQHLLQATSTPMWSPQSRCCVTPPPPFPAQLALWSALFQKWSEIVRSFWTWFSRKVWTRTPLHGQGKSDSLLQSGKSVKKQGVVSKIFQIWETNWQENIKFSSSYFHLGRTELWSEVISWNWKWVFVLLARVMLLAVFANKYFHFFSGNFAGNFVPKVGFYARLWRECIALVLCVFRVFGPPPPAPPPTHVYIHIFSHMTVEDEMLRCHVRLDVWPGGAFAQHPKIWVVKF